MPVVAIGKIEDLFAGRGMTSCASTRRSDDHGMDEIEAAMAATDRRADLRQPRRLRHRVRPSQRRRPATPPTSSASTRGWRRCCRACAPTISSSSPPITATIRRRRAPIIRASTCRCCSTARRCGRHSTSARGATFADLGQTLAELFGVGPLPHGTSFLARDPVEMSRSIRMTDDDSRTTRSSASATSSRRRRPRAPTRAAGCAPRPRIRSARRSSAIAIASSTARRSAG